MTKGGVCVCLLLHYKAVRGVRVNPLLATESDFSTGFLESTLIQTVTKRVEINTFRIISVRWNSEQFRVQEKLLIYKEGKRFPPEGRDVS